MDKRSEPAERDIATRIANPRLASHAPSVSRINRKNGFVCGYSAYIRTISVVRVRTIVSIASRTISRWVRWDKNRRNVRVRVIVRKRESGKAIAGGISPFFGLQDQCYLLASSAVRRRRTDY